ncbi:MAG: dephospho-CoA kinase [bacterium]
MKRIGLTGGIGCGKSTVLALFRELGAAIVDTDQVARDVVAPGTRGLAKIVATFGREVLLADGSLDRAKLAARVFQDPQARRKLEAITHPLIRRALMLRFVRLALARVPVVIVEAPLLFETGGAGRFHETVAVIADERVIHERLRARNGWSDDEIRARLASQLPLAEKARRATHVIENSGDLEAARRRVRELMERWTGASGTAHR